MMIHTLAPLPGMFMLEEPAALPEDLQAYCVRCRTDHTMTHAQLVTTRTGKLAARGKCEVCGTTMMKFLPAP
jgi:DNA topoisomerase-1